MAKITREEFKQVLVRLCPNVQYGLENNPAYLVRAVTEAAAYCFAHETDDSGDSELLKEQYLCLEKCGCFDFE